MKKILTIFLIFIFITFAQIFPFQTHANSNYYHTYNVEHLFTHCLIAYPEIAFSKQNPMRKHLLQDCITSSEFFKLLTSLHNNNYILISINDCFKDSLGTATKTKVKVPAGKKPIILSFDDVNYDSKKLGTGMVDKIILDSNNNIATSTIVNGKEEISYNKEFVNILEDFIENNPDFSPFGAKGCINLTGYDGILGYRTSHTNTINRNEEIQKAQNVATKLKILGWDFACHSYGHYHMKKISVEKFNNELKLWEDEVASIVGKTNIYVYPFGEWEVFSENNLSEKHKLLNKYGYTLFCGVGMKTYYSYLPTSSNNKVLFMDRKCVDGYTLTKNHKELFPFCNPLELLDKNR